MTLARGLPTIGGIQRANMIIAAIVAALLYQLASPAMALACLIGALVMIVNLYVLAGLGRLMIAAANGGAGGALGAIVAPLKLLILIFVVYVLLARGGVDVVGFGIGVLTQFCAILIETGRVTLTGVGAEN